MYEKNIYVVISKTHTKFGGAIRFVTHTKYNHASIALDDNLDELYSFARKKYDSPMDSGLVKENVSRFTLCKYDDDTPVKIFKIPVTNVQYEKIKHKIALIASDNEYKYNLFSALTYPLFKGVKTYKALTCIEFVMNMLAETDVVFDKPECSYHPQDLEVLLKKYEYYCGQLVEYRNFDQDVDADFFSKSGIYEKAYKSVSVIVILFGRTIRHRT